jgi:hypothetical protein
VPHYNWRTNLFLIFSPRENPFGIVAIGLGDKMRHRLCLTDLELLIISEISERTEDKSPNQIKQLKNDQLSFCFALFLFLLFINNHQLIFNQW